MRLNLDYDKKCHRKEIVRELQTLFATHHMMHGSPMREDIARAVGISPERLDKLTEKKAWGDALSFWTGGENRSLMPTCEIEKTLTGDMKTCEKFWLLMLDQKAIQDLQQWTHSDLRGDDDYPPDVLDVDDLKPRKRLARWYDRHAYRARRGISKRVESLLRCESRLLHRGIAAGLSVAFVIGALTS